jgi:predicted naringenin-chalcone synthase
MALSLGMVIAGLGTAAPPQAYAQGDGWEAVQRAPQFAKLTPRSRAILKKVLTGNNGIRTRHLALEDLADAFDLSPAKLHERFRQHAPLLASQAATRALDQAHLRPEQVDALLVSTCTGYLCPGLTSYVGERLRLRPDVLALDFVGQGCGAALPNLRTAEALLQAGRCGRVLSVCVEVCSAAFYLDNDPGVLISACLFGDGAGAAVFANHLDNGSRRLEIKSCHSLHQPADRELLRFEQRDGMLRNILAPEVPRIASEAVKRLLDAALATAQLRQADIKSWILHPGGRDVLASVQQRLGLVDSDLRWSAEVLEEFGNLSSASVFFVLERALAGGAPPGYWWMSSFGAGFSVHGALWEAE